MADLRALITGSSSGIGLALAQHLLEMEPELQLVGLSRQAGPLASHGRFEHWESDLSDPEVANKRASRYLQDVGVCDLLIHAAGRGLFRPSNEWSVEEVQNLMNLNLVTPVGLTGRLTQALRKSQGMVIFVGSTSFQERAPLGSAYAASKAGLHRFADNYFQENRKHGVRVLHLCPGLVKTNFHAQERFEPRAEAEFSVDLQSLAELVWFFFRGAGRGANPTHLVLEPQKVGISKK